MKIKGADGHEYNVTGQGQGNFNTVGAAGGIGWIADKLFGGNLFGGNGCSSNPQDTPISRYEATMMQELAAKDGKIALLESNIYTDQKIADVYERLITRINADKDAQTLINQNQAVYNGVNSATIQCLQNQVAQLLGITKIVIPATSICPQPTTT